MRLALGCWWLSEGEAGRTATGARLPARGYLVQEPREVLFQRPTEGKGEGGSGDGERCWRVSETVHTWSWKSCRAHSGPRRVFQSRPRPPSFPEKGTEVHPHTHPPVIGSGMGRRSHTPLQRHSYVLLGAKRQVLLVSTECEQRRLSSC